MNTTHQGANVNPDMTPANGYTGRGPTGRLRNFKAMTDMKLEGVLAQVVYEGDDPEAINAIRTELADREASR